MPFFLLLVGWMHVLLAPYTKVEESFNLHAVHDLIFYGPLSLRNYDHFLFPGVVPRSFIGSIALSALVFPLKFLVRALGFVHSKFDVQILVRLTLATVNALGLLHLRRATTRSFGRTTSNMFVLLTCTQFHLPFWMGRTLPNMLALFPVTVASASLPSQRHYSLPIALLTFAAVTLRAELVLFLAPVVLQALYLRHTTFWVVLRTGVVAGLLSLALTVCIDSYFWDRWPLWPEFAGLYFNVYEGKSAEWGTSPPYAYFISHLPKLLLSSLPLSLLGLLVDVRIRTLLLPCLAFIALLSCLGHKEWRFIVYIIPLWNIAGARGAALLVSGRARGLAGYLCKLTLLGLIVGNVLVTALLTQASMANYPGGEALTRLNRIVLLAEQADEVSVHIGNYATQTGASLFLHELVPRVVYDKTEHIVGPGGFQGFDWVITEDIGEFGEEWMVENNVEGLRGVELRVGSLPRVVREPKLWILRKRAAG